MFKDNSFGCLLNLKHLTAVLEDNVESVLSLFLVGVGDHSERYPAYMSRACQRDYIIAQIGHEDVSRVAHDRLCRSQETNP